MSKPGIGECGNPYCSEPKAEGRYTCETHGKELDRIKDELESDPELLWNKRIKGKQNKRPPTCVVQGCFEIRVPPDPYCYEHGGT